ncbi:MAG: hypothetical protein ACR2NZ_25105 [Rubripirellula sp.]
MTASVDSGSIVVGVLAQSAQASSFSLWPVAITLVGFTIALAFGCTLLAIVLKSVRHARDLLHDERMKALEKDLPWMEEQRELPIKAYVDSAFWICFWMVIVGCGVPFAAIAVAGRFSEHESISIPIVAWSAACAASIAAVVCATIVMANARRGLKGNEPDPQDRTRERLGAERDTRSHPDS